MIVVIAFKMYIFFGLFVVLLLATTFLSKLVVVCASNKSRKLIAK